MTELAVLVPVLNRPQNVKPLVDSFLVGCPEGSALHFIVDPNDLNEYGEVIRYASSEPHWIERIEVDERDALTWPAKINYAVADTMGRTNPDWYLFAADDITFTPGWWEATEELRNDEGIGVIGTSDSASGLGNPRVAAGEHTCHPLVRASYVRSMGTIDEPGLAVHPGYYHWCVDDELVWTAKSRNAWAFCREAVIEHHHPYWDKGIQWDDTYALGESKANEDMKLWSYRAQHVLGLTTQ